MIAADEYLCRFMHEYTCTDGLMDNYLRVDSDKQNIGAICKILKVKMSEISLLNINISDFRNFGGTTCR